MTPVPPDPVSQREELVRRVAVSRTFEKSPRLRAFFLHVCRCALENNPAGATEQQIAVHVYERHSGYNPNEDNIVRSQARLLRMKLEHHFATDGKDETIVITIPKGRYLPLFEARTGEPAPSVVPPLRRWLWPAAAVLAVLVTASVAYRAIAPAAPASPARAASDEERSETTAGSALRPQALPPSEGEVRIACGRTEASYVDLWGRQWDADRYYEGGHSRPGPRHVFPPVADPGLLRTIREAESGDPSVPQSQREFRYDIPLRPGAYELRLYFADPLRKPEAESQNDAQDRRRFHVSLNGRPLLADYDAVAGAGTAAVDVRAFRDVGPAADGKLHLQFRPAIFGARPFLSAIELTPGTPGKLKPIRLCTQRAGLVDASGTTWTADNHYIGGAVRLYQNAETGPQVPPLYAGERYGNFSYAIPVPPGQYTLRVHFLESFFSPLVPAAQCHGAGCRVFNVSCNGVMLLQNFDISQQAPNAFQPVVREFHGLRPNGQGKLLLAFSPEVNYAEVRALEVLDEAKY